LTTGAGDLFDVLSQRECPTAITIVRIAGGDVAHRGLGLDADELDNVNDSGHTTVRIE